MEDIVGSFLRALRASAKPVYIYLIKRLHVCIPPVYVYTPMDVSLTVGDLLQIHKGTPISACKKCHILCGIFITDCRNRSLGYVNKSIDPIPIMCAGNSRELQRTNKFSSMPDSS